MTKINMTIAYLNGEFLPLENAKISVLDRGFIFADGVYEVIPVYNGKSFELAQHLRRLANSLEKIQLNNPLSSEEWQTIIAELIAKNGYGHQAIYLQVTRGVAIRDHKFPEQSIPTVLLWSTPFIPPPMSAGIKAITCPDTRWQHCDIKSISLIANVLYRQKAITAGVHEAILIRDPNTVTEGAASNLFIVSKGTVITPPKNQFILAGITREVILAIMKKTNIAYQETSISETQLRQADEIWLSSSTREISPVTLLDGQPIGTGQAGVFFTKVYELFQQYKQEYYC